MLNELYRAKESLKHKGVLQQNTYINISSVAKTEAILIEVDKNGVPKEFRVLSKQQTGELWKHSKGNHHGFPAIRVQKPLLAESESQKVGLRDWKKLSLSQKKESLLTLDFDKLNERCREIMLSEWSFHEFQQVVDKKVPEIAAVSQLVEVFPRREEETVRFMQGVVMLIQERLCSPISEEELNLLKLLLVGEGKGTEYKAGCMTYYDVYETEKFENKVMDQKTRDMLVKLFLANGTNNEADREEEEVSFLSGNKVRLIHGKYPNPKLPLIGLTYLYSKKSDIQCLNRYGRKGLEAFQAGADEIEEINNTLAFLTASTRKNKTWTSIANCYGKSPNLLLAYLEDDPSNDALLAELLGNFEEAETDEIMDIFEELCHQVLGKLEEVMNKNPRSVIQLLIIESLDPGRKQIAYSQSFSLNQLKRNMMDWEAATKNHPPIEFLLVNKKHKNISQYGYLDPNRICELMKLQCTYSGEVQSAGKCAMTLEQIYGLYMSGNSLNQDRCRFLGEYLNILLRKTFGLLRKIGQSNYHNGTNNKQMLEKSADVLHLIVILLWKMQIRKEDYMKGCAYNIGQLLQLGDGLHKEYCIQVRNEGNPAKPVPAQLIGNGLLQEAINHPVDAINRLGERLRVYIAWAKSCPYQKNKLSKWYLARIQEVTSKIAENDIPEAFSSVEQAEVLLGYLAKIAVSEEENHE